jgi:hypothetical protein
MTEPNHYRFYDSCGFEGDASRFIRKGPDGVAIRSKYKTAHLDQLRYGIREAQENGYYPYAEFCPLCGYNSDINDEVTNARCLEKGRRIRIRSKDVRQLRRNKDKLQLVLLILITGLVTLLLILYA